MSARRPAALALMAAALTLAACAEGGDDPAPSTASDAPAEAAPAAPETAAPATAGKQYAPEDVPAIWMGIEGGEGRPTSVVFAIDGALDGSVANDKAVRITPVPTAGGAGNCDIKDLEGYNFTSTGPIFSHVQANQGVQPSEIPQYLAFTASQSIVASGLAADAEGTVPQNICTRKFWELWLSQAQPIEPGGAGS